MVKLGTFITLGLLAVGAAVFLGLGGASGIGQRIGGGFRVFGESIVSGISGTITDPITKNVENLQEIITNPSGGEIVPESGRKDPRRETPTSTPITVTRILPRVTEILRPTQPFGGGVGIPIVDKLRVVVTRADTGRRTILTGPLDG